MSGDHLKAGELLGGKYRVERLLGEGGMGVVYAARHELIGQAVAVKLLRNTLTLKSDAAARFLREARNASRIQSDHVARVLDMGTVDSGAPYMVIELLEGADLATVLSQREKPPEVHEVVDWLLEATEAIAHAHALGIVHRDLKPSNLFLATRPDGTKRIKVLDFGISKTLDRDEGNSAGDVTSTNSVLGSPLYMSPEQLLDAKRVDERADIWALGVIAYELLTRTLPFRADGVVALFEIIHRTSPPPLGSLRSDIPPGLEEAVLRCLRPDANDRFPSVTDLGAAWVRYGTPAATVTFERIERVLPSSLPMEVRTTAPGGTLAERPGASREPSTPPWSAGSGWRPALKSVSGGSRLPARSGLSAVGGPALLLGAALLLAALGMGGSRLLRARLLTAVAAPAASASPEIPPSGPFAAPSAPPATNAGEAAGEPSSSSPGHSSSAASHPSEPPPPIRIPPRSAAAPAPPGPRATVTGACDPPFYFGDRGVRIFKKECL